MSFPYHDPLWTEAAAFVERRASGSDSILAPDLFWWRFPKIYRYINTRFRPEQDYDWIIFHKGLVNELPGRFLKQAFDRLKPVFANEVFVILARTADVKALNGEDPHLLALTQRLPILAAAEESLIARSEEPVLPDPGAIFKFSQLDDSEFATAMDMFWKNGGYIYSTLRDKAYYDEIDRSIAEYIGHESDQTILDVACGIGRLSKLLKKENRIIGIDISGVAIDFAKERHRDQPNFSFQRMDAHSLSFAEGSFDIVLFIDAIEHVKDADKVVSELSRVLRPGGQVLLTVANRDSVNQVLTRKLGYQEFVTNYQHIREFSFAETRNLLCSHQLEIEQSRGIFLYPYWGVPGIDEVVREVTDEDPDFVELMRLLGERVGAEHSYCSVVLARKPMDQ